MFPVLANCGGRKRGFYRQKLKGHELILSFHMTSPKTIDSSEFYEVLQHLNTFITRDDVVSQRLKFGSAFLSYSWESKNALFFQLSCIPSPSRTNCVIFIGCNFESRAIQVGLHKENKDTASAKKGELCLLVS